MILQDSRRHRGGDGDDDDDEIKDFRRRAPAPPLGGDHGSAGFAPPPGGDDDDDDDEIKDFRRRAPAPPLGGDYGSAPAQGGRRRRNKWHACPGSCTSVY